MLSKFYSLVDRNGRAYFTYIALARWLTYYIELTNSLFIASALILSYFLAAYTGSTSIARMALAITSSLSVFEFFQNIFRNSIVISSAMASV